MKYDKIFELIPQTLQEEENATNFKELLKIYGETTEIVDMQDERYGNILDVSIAVDDGLDFIGYLYMVYRKPNESNEDYRNRIYLTMFNRKTKTTIFGLQNAINSIEKEGEIFIKENPYGREASVFLTGTSTGSDYINVFNIISSILPAGVGISIPIVGFEIWQDVKDQFDTWGSISEQGYLW